MQGSQSAFLRTLPRTPRSQSAVRTRSPHSCKPCLGHPVRSPQSALAVRIPTLPLRRPRPQSAVRTRGPHSDRNQRWHMSPPRRPQTCAISDFGRNADCECGLRTANGVYEAEFAGMRIAGCGLRIIWLYSSHCRTHWVRAVNEYKPSIQNADSQSASHGCKVSSLAECDSASSERHHGK